MSRLGKKPEGRRVALVLLTLLAAASASLQAQDSTVSSPDSEHVLRVNVDLVSLPVAVTDEHFRSYGGLQKENFEVYENKVPQQINSVNQVDTPISVVLVFDRSGSVTGDIDLCKAFVREFFRFANPEDEYSLVEFNQQAYLLVPFTPQINRVMDFVGAARAAGRTAMFDAVVVALGEMQQVQNKRKVILLLTDGQDNYSTYGLKDIKNQLAQREDTTQIYTIGVVMGGFMSTYFGNTWEIRQGLDNLTQLAEVSGGKSFEISNPAEIPEVAAAISRELRVQYEVSYYSSNRTHDGRWRSVRVEVKPPRGAPPLVVRARPGYNAPPS